MEAHHCTQHTTGSVRKQLAVFGAAFNQDFEDSPARRCFFFGLRHFIKECTRLHQALGSGEERHEHLSAIADLRALVHDVQQVDERLAIPQPRQCRRRQIAVALMRHVHPLRHVITLDWRRRQPFHQRVLILFIALSRNATYAPALPHDLRAHWQPPPVDGSSINERSDQVVARIALIHVHTPVRAAHVDTRQIGHPYEV